MDSYPVFSGYNANNMSIQAKYPSQKGSAGSRAVLTT